MKLTEKQKQLIFETVIRNEQKKHINENNLGLPTWAIEHGFKHSIHELDGQIVRGWVYAHCFETEDGIIVQYELDTQGNVQDLMIIILTLILMNHKK